MKTFEKLVTKAFEFAFNLYEIVGALALLFIVYGFLWLIVSIAWKKVHSESYDSFISAIYNALGKKREVQAQEDTTCSVSVEK